jgi:hypothetical protein
MYLYFLTCWLIRLFFRWWGVSLLWSLCFSPADPLSASPSSTLNRTACSCSWNRVPFSTLYVRTTALQRCMHHKRNLVLPNRNCGRWSLPLCYCPGWCWGPSLPPSLSVSYVQPASPVWPIQPYFVVRQSWASPSWERPRSALTRSSHLSSVTLGATWPCTTVGNTNFYLLQCFKFKTEVQQRKTCCKGSDEPKVNKVFISRNLW